MIASIAARLRESTSAAASIATPTLAAKMPMARRACTRSRRSTGAPMAARCATKFRLPKVPPGERLRLK